MGSIKNMIIIMLLVLVIGLFYLIIIGKFCKCSDVKCPNYQKSIYEKEIGYAT